MVLVMFLPPPPHPPTPPNLPLSALFLRLLQALQLAIDHGVFLCVRYSWQPDTGTVNIVTGDEIAGTKKERASERKASALTNPLETQSGFCILI